MKSANSSDLTRACTLAEQLARNGPPWVPHPRVAGWRERMAAVTPADHRYTLFRAPSSALGAVGVSEPPMDPAELADVTTLEALCVGWRRTCGAKSVFVVDAAGAVRAREGVISEPIAHGIGTRLRAILEQANRLATPSHPVAVSVHLEKLCLSGLQVTQVPGGPLIAGMVAARPIPLGISETVAQAIVRIVGNTSA